MEGFSRTVNVLLFVLFHTMKEVSSSGKISINLKRYENPGGEGHNGHCCDGRAFFCFGACDHRFLLCVDDRYGSSNMGRCPYGRVQTGVIHDADTIVFYGSVGGTRNPMTLNFNTWPGSVKLKVYVEDYDDNSNDYVDYLTTVITATPDKSDDAAYPSSYLLRRRTRLSIEVKVYCDNYYFGPRCDVYCEPRDDHTGHYTCDQANGNKICKPGWSGTFCASSNDDCIGNQCQNGAICMDSHRSYICACSDGFTGKFCEQDIDECSVGLPCANGGSCVNTHGGYSCRCAHAWTGTDCSEAVNFCESNPCRNGAVCHSSQAGYHCACSKSWTGSQCDQNVDECLAEPCLNNGTCLDTHGSFQCLCINGTTGHLCEINIDDCASGPCIHDNATCNDIINGYKCACPPGITGTNCTGEMFEIQLPTTLDSSEEDIVRGALQDILQENSDYAQGEIHIETHFGTFTSHDGDVSTVISLKAFYKETQLDQSFLQKIYTPDKLAQLKELLHLRKEESVQLLQISEEKPHEKENWALSHWYAILIIALVVIVLLLIPVAIHIRRKRGRRASEMDLTAYWPASQDVPSLGFENVVYNVEHQPQYQNIPAESENSEEMTDLTSGPSNVAKGRRMDSFKNESSRS